MQQPRLGKTNQQPLETRLAFQIDHRLPADDAMLDRQVLTSREALAAIPGLPAQQQHRVSRSGEPRAQRVSYVFQQAYRANHRCRVDRLALCLVVERHVATDNRHAKRPGRRRPCL